MFNFFSKKRREKALRGEEEKDLFTHKYKAFRELLDANNAVLATMADMQEKASGAYVFDAAYVESSYRSVSKGINRIIDSLNQVSGNKYKDLVRASDRINKTAQEILHPAIAIPKTDYVLALESVHKDMAPSCGGKMAYLGEVANNIRLQVPNAFVITTFSYQSFVRHNQIEALLEENCGSVDIRDYAALEDASRAMQGLVQKSQVPADLQNAIFQAFEEMERQTGNKSLHVSVRSSAILEDIMASFAGQYATVLNVTRENLIEAYKKVISSQFTPRALFYFKDKGFNINEMAMAAGVVQMIDPASSGIAYSRDPRNPDEDVVLINAVWGLGDYAVGGMVPPETLKVIAPAKDGKGSRVSRKKECRQRVMSRASADGGTQEVAVPEHMQDTSCLDEDQVLKLSNLARVLESHFESPQDMEWALDHNGVIQVLQSRPLRMPYMHKEKLPDKPRHVEGHELLLDKGKIACRGVSAGPVRQVRDERAMGDFPEGGVLVIRQAHPEFALILDKATAVISDTGSVLGHLATVARELDVPAILNAEDATRVLRDGMLVTVDAQYGRVYEGEVGELLKAGKQTGGFSSSPIYRRLRTILKEITPLYMTDPRGPDFKAKTCRTFHDITRFSHEMALREMFDFGKHTYFSEKSAKKLVSKDIPLEWLVIDLEDGLKQGLGKRIGPEDIVSEPMRAMWEGMTAVPWKGPPPMDTKGFLSVVAGSAIDPDAASYLTDKNYIVLSKDFCNLSVRLGFHFSTTESYVGGNENQNYVSFAFKGGGADSGRRNRRVAFISRILGKFDFRVEVREDSIFARIEGHEEAFLKERLKVLGHVIVHTRQMDMVMHNEKMVEWYYKDMIKGIESFVNIPH
jgi:pyruvate,water dikinase